MFGTGKRSSVSFFFFCFFFFVVVVVVVVFSLRLFVPPPFFFASFRRFFSASRFFRFRFFRRALSFRSSSGVSPSPPSPQITGQNLSAAFQPLSFRPPCLMNLLRGSHSAHVGTSSVIVREHAVREEKKSVSEYVRLTLIIRESTFKRGNGGRAMLAIARERAFAHQNIFI